MKYNQTKTYVWFFVVVVLVFLYGWYSIKHPVKDVVSMREYEVKVVRSYMAAQTTYHGGIYGYETRYSFDYETRNGIKTIDEYHLDSKHEIIYGDENKYTITTSSVNGVIKECLYIKEDDAARRISVKTEVQE